MKDAATWKPSAVAGLFFGLSIFCALSWFVWELHPWVAEGTGIWLGDWQFGSDQFQVWQRKNESALEPFADGLFVRNGTNRWMFYCFDIQDSYAPRIELRKESDQIYLFRNSKKIGAFDPVRRTFQKSNHLIPMPPEEMGEIDREPPGQWWLRQPTLTVSAIPAR